MNIAISNIAWEHSEDEAISQILQKYEIKGIEIAPTKIWSDPTTVSSADTETYKRYWEEKGINIVAMQSLLFGHPELTLFETAEKRKNLLDYLTKIIHLASLLGVTAMVFGSPKNRIKGNLDEAETSDIGNDFFRKLGDVAQNYDIAFCIEANPIIYGTDFLTTTKDVVEFVKEVDHPNINVHLDSGAMQINNEDIEQTITSAQPFSHFHISEPNLLSVPQEVDHRAAAKTLQEINYNKWVSIEMRAVNTQNNIPQIDKTLDFVTKTYRS
jgi:D-psicose/D-tagatose/L-ribulose 3-epimerase